MAYAPVRERIVVFGGLIPSGEVLADSSEYDGVQWIQKTPQHLHRRAGTRRWCSIPFAYVW